MKKSRMLMFISVLIFLADAQDIRITSDTIISSDIEIPVGSKLHISPGVTLHFEGYRTVLVKGSLMAFGTADKPIVFTGVDMAYSPEANPTWKGVEIIGKEANAEFRFCKFEKAFRVLVWDSKPYFDNCSFVNNYYGLFCTRNASPEVQNSSFTQNSYGISIDFAAPRLINNIISGNSTGIYLQLCSRDLIRGNTITKNGVDIKSENETVSGFLTPEAIWSLMQQMY